MLHWLSWEEIMRNAFMEELVSAAEYNEKIVLVVGDLGFGVVEPFAERFPRRFFNAGVAEQNMMGLASGLASEGFQVFVYSIGNFPTYRCAEQIRNDVDHHNLPVTTVVVGGGLCYGSLGYSHHAIQDYGLMRAFPNMLIAAPGDPYEVRACVRYILKNPQPSYLRLAKVGERHIHNEVPEVEPGKWICVKANVNSSKTFLTTGATLDIADRYIRSLNNEDLALHSLPLWGMQSKSKQAKLAENWDRIVTLEDHLLDAGFGSWLLESLNARSDLVTKVLIRGLDSSVCGMVAKQDSLNAAAGLSDFENLFGI